MDKVGFILLMLCGFCAGNAFQILGRELLEMSMAEAIELPASSTCENSACSCKDCKCDPCECPCDVDLTLGEHGEFPRQVTSDMTIVVLADSHGSRERDFGHELQDAGYKVEQIDLFDEEEKQRYGMAEKNGSTRTPQFAIIQNGKAIYRHVGYYDKSQRFPSDKLASLLDVKPEAKSSGERIYFFTMGEACQPCMEMKPVVEKMKADGHRIVTMDIQEPKNKKYVDYYNAYTVPVFVTVDQNGYEIRRTEAGLSTPDVILGKVSLQATPSVKSSGPVLYTTSSCSSGSCGSYSTSYRTSRPRWFRARSCGPGGCR